MKIIRNLFKPKLLLILTFFLAGCQNEAIESDVESETITKAKNWFKNSPNLPIVQNKFFRNNIDWDKSFTDNEKLYVPFLDSNLSITKVEKVDGNTKTSRSYLVFTKLEKDSYNLNLEIYFSNDFSNLEDVEILKLPYVKIDQNNRLISNSITSKSDQAPEPVCEEYGYYEISYDPNTGETEKTLLYRFKICSSNWNGDYEGNGGGGSGGITAPKSTKIIDALTGKAKCLNELLNKNGDSFVQKLLANFQGKSEFDIKIVSVDKIIVKDVNGNLVESNGETTYNSKINPSLINIVISTSRADANSSLDVARTILHEYIHADIIRKLYTANNIPGTLDFNLIYEKYGSQHGTMAALYLSSMKEALKEFNKIVLPNDYKNYTDYYGEEPSDAFYEALAWSGLKDNNVKAWADLSAQKKQEINDLASRVTKMSKTVNCP